MKNNSRIAQQLRSLSLQPSLESEDSSVETGAAGEGVVQADLAPAQDVPADGAGAPGEDKDVTATVVTEDEGPKEEAAETVSEDSAATVSTESEEESSVVTGDGEVTQVAEVAPAQETPADGAGAPAEDQDLTTTQVEEDKGPKEESAETVSEDSPAVAEQIAVSTESEGESASEAAAEPNAEQAAAAEESSVVTGDGEQTQAVEVEAAQETPADGAGAPGEDAEVTATIVEVGERSELESAETEVTDSQDLEVSQEGLLGAVKGFALGTAGLILAPLTLGLSPGAIDAGMKDRRLKLANEINVLGKRLADLKNGDTKQALKEGIKVPKEQTDQVSAGEIVKSFILGMVVPFYSTYQGHKIEELEIELAGKVAALKLEMAKHGVATEGLEDGEAAVAAAAAFAEGAAGAAEAVAAAVDAGTPEVVEEAAVAEAVEEVAAEAGEAAAEAAPEGEAVEAAAEVVEEAVEDVVEDDVAAAEAEMEELEEGLDEGEKQIEVYENESATLESLIDALKDAQQTGGLSMQSARFFQIGFESVGVRLTGKPFQNTHGESAIPSLESFGGTMRKDKATEISMEAATDVLKRIWEVLKRTYQQVKEWLVKFFQLVLDKSARVKAKAEKIKAAAAKLGNQKPATSKFKFGGAGKLAINGRVQASDLSDLVGFAKEAGERNSEASRVLIQVRQDLRSMIDAATRGQEATTAVAASGNAVATGELRSAVFNLAYKGEEGEGYKTKVLPGNVEFLAIDPLGENGSLAGLLVAAARGWKVVQIGGGEAFDGEVDVLTGFHIKEIADSALDVISAVESAKAALKDEALSITDMEIPAEVSPENAKSIKATAWLTGKILHAQSSSIAKMLKYCVNTSDTYLDYAAASLKQYQAATA